MLVITFILVYQLIRKMYDSLYYFGNIFDQKSCKKMMEFQSSQLDDVSAKSKSAPVVIGYYNLRGKAQVPRLLLQYLQVNYQDKIFNLQEWQKYSVEQTKNFAFPVLPFLKQGSFVCTDSVPMCTYIINRFGSAELLGRNLRDQALIEMYFWTIPYMQNVISINSVQMTPQELNLFKERQWKSNVYPRIAKLQEAAKDQWFLGYLTIIDFSIYELIRYIDCIFIGKTKQFTKLKKIEQRFGNLPTIKKYEASSRAVVEWCPTKLLQSFKAMMAKNDSKLSQGSKQQKK